MYMQLLYTLCIAFIATLVTLNWSKIELAINQSKSGDPVKVNSVFGSLIGQTGVTREGRTIYKFTSIPYAKPPVGSFRFEPPVQFGEWKGELDATKKAPACPQVEIVRMQMFGQENCLYLNVYTPKIHSRKLLPVMVFIYGGYFMFGSSEFYGPEYLLDEDVVLVTLNYRTNVLGFLNTGDQTVTGNMGLKDQIKAFQWVQAAIAAFGGDSKRVTLFGNSAGAASVSYHMISKMSQGLFDKAISQSGTSLCGWTMMHNPKERAVRFAKMVGCPIHSSRELVECLKKAPLDDLMNVHREILNVFCDKEAFFAPSLEYTDENTDLGKVFLHESPNKLMEEGKFYHVPWINGLVENEGCFKSAFVVNDPVKLQEINQDWITSMSNLLNLSPTDPKLLWKIRKEYFPSNKSFHETKIITGEDLPNITNVISDHWFFGCAKKAAIFHSKHASVYLYYFNKKPEIGYGYILEATRISLPAPLASLLYYLKFILYNHLLGWEVDHYGVCHSDELQQLFMLNPLLSIPQDSEKFPFSKEMIQLWVSFVKNGKPDAFRGVHWDAYNNEVNDLMYLRLGDNPAMIQEPFALRLSFWESLNLPTH